MFGKYNMWFGHALWLVSFVGFLICFFLHKPIPNLLLQLFKLATFVMILNIFMILLCKRRK